MKRLALCLLLSGCAHTVPAEPVVVTKTVTVPIAVPCVVALPAPIYADTDEALIAAPDIFERVKLLLAGREQRDQLDREQIAAAAGCVR